MMFDVVGEGALWVLPDQADNMTTEDSHAFDTDGGGIQALMECAGVEELMKKGVWLDK
ncbi:hypothetical protein RvY_11819 [Ramazzottius varieornatus]|uniref:Uncharacterized protein n=1 Tax=Ramazzottius varieornatus TaxID=947166 RepID=A0A1D1VMR8_RAMVA|nr:hypothetical protein RvY_11819 [Ramazzottius varieornatus]